MSGGVCSIMITKSGDSRSWDNVQAGTDPTWLIESFQGCHLVI